MNKKPMTQETKDKLRLSHLGKKHSPETREKISKALKKRITPEIYEGLKSHLLEIRKKAHHFGSTDIKEKEQLRKKYAVKNKWDGDLYSIKLKVKSHFRFRMWRKEVLNTQKKCSLCDSKKHLEVHHEKELIDIIKENLTELVNHNYEIPELWDIENGKVFCTNCHSVYHSHTKRMKKRSYIELLKSIISWNDNNNNIIPENLKAMILIAIN